MGRLTDFTDNAGSFPESWHGTKGWPDARKMVSRVNVVKSHRTEAEADVKKVAGNIGWRDGEMD